LDTGKNNTRSAFTCCAITAVLVFLVFGRTLHFASLTYDDDHCVFNNRVVMQGLTPKSIAWAFTHAELGNWIPLTTISHMLDSYLFGIQPWGHHLTNVLLHAVTAILLVLFVREIGGSIAVSFFIGSIFAVHPLRAESVAWIAERKDVLSGMFFMIALLTYVRFTENRSIKWYFATLTALALGLMSKPMLVTTPVVMLLLDYWPLRRLGGGKALISILVEKVPLFALSGAAAVATMITQSNAHAINGSLDLVSKLSNAVVSYFVYIRQMLVPYRLVAFYPETAHHKSLTIALVLVAVGVSTVAWVQRHRRPYLIVGWLWFIVMLLPVSGIIKAGAQAHADRFTYLPQIGLYIVIGWAAAELISRRPELQRPLAIVGSCIIVTLAACCYQQTGYWQDGETLWAHTIECIPPNFFAEMDLGTAIDQKGRLTEAIPHYQNALRLNPDFADAHNNYGSALMRMGDLTEAAAHYETALRIAPTLAEAHFNYAILCDMQGKTSEAISRYEKAIKFDPDYPGAQYNLANDYLKEGRLPEAALHFREVLEIDPKNASAHLNLANTLVEEGKITESLVQYEAALKSDPSKPLIYYNFGLVLARQGRMSDALQQLHHALTIALAHQNSQLADAARAKIEAVEATMGTSTPR
jgi:tetratricopeptide (TPR) repeat protein